MDEAKPQILLWSHPECPYRIAILAPVLNEVRILAVEAFYSVPRGGVEIGGVFFGVRRGATLEIRAHRRIKCQYATGPSFSLSVNDQVGLAGLLETAGSDPDLEGTVPVGWYHSHTRSELFLSPADLQLYNEFFPERWQIALVLRPANLQATRGGFFFRDRTGSIQSDTPVEEFKLEPPNFGLSPAPDEASVTGVPAGPEPKPIVAAAPVPIEIPSAPLAGRASSGAAAVALAVIEPPNPSKLEIEPKLAVKPTPGPAPAPASIPTPDIAPPAPSNDPQINLPSFIAAAKPRSERRITWVWTSIFILLAGAGGAAAYWKLGPLSPTADLGLETYDINGSFLIRWDRESKVVRNATRATIEIQDGPDKSQPFELSRGELAMGGYGYIRHTPQVSVHMKVEGQYPADEYRNYNDAQALGSQPASAGDPNSPLEKAVAEKEHLKTELINESMQTLELRKQVADLKNQLAEERARNASPQK